MMSFIAERLRRNDPQDTQFRIPLVGGDVSDATLTDALERNHHVVTLSFFVVDAPGLSWPRLLRHLETRSNLFRVVLIFNEPQNGTLVAQLQSWLKALQRNSNIRHLNLVGYLSVRVIASHLNEATTHITNLSIIGILENNDSSLDGPALFASALQRHPNLQQLELAYVQAEYLVALFDSLRTNQSLQTLNVCVPDFSAAALASFQKLMRRTLTIRKLIIYNGPPAPRTRPRNPALVGATRETILEVVKSNFSLREVRGENDDYSEGADAERNVFRANDRRLLAFYADRNERLAQWIDQPTDNGAVPNRKLWSHVLTVAAAAPDPSLLFRCLVAIRGDLGTTRRTRKRRRPAYF